MGVVGQHSRVVLAARSFESHGLVLPSPMDTVQPACKLQLIRILAAELLHGHGNASLNYLAEADVR